MALDREKLKAMLRVDEAVRKYPYDDATGKAPQSKGKITIGVGRNLTDRGLRPSEIDFLLDNDIDAVLGEIALHAPWFAVMSDARQLVVANMVFNLGWPRFAGFKLTIALLAKGKYAAAADAMLDSKWATQVGQRAETLADMMRTG